MSPQRWILFLLLVPVMIFPAGCAGVPTQAELSKRKDLTRVAARYRPGDARPELPKLTEKSGIDDYLRYAMFNNPKVEAAYYEWFASVERITVSRSLMDPRFTFSADITDILESVMAGLMVDLPGPGKLRIAGDVAAAESMVRYYDFELEVIRTAFAVKEAYYRLQYLEDALKVQRVSLRLLIDLEETARYQNAVGRATLQDALQAQIEQERLKTRIENMEDSRGTLAAELKAALGMGKTDPDPPLPVKFIPSKNTTDPGMVLDIALRRNPAIRQMKAEVERAESMLELAHKTGVPDLTLGLEAELKNTPTMWTPSVGVTLPIWRDRIAAEIAGARAGERAAQARLSNEQVQLAAELAAMLYMYRESTRNMELFEDRLIPRGRQSLEASRTGYANGKSSFLEVIESYRQILDFDLFLVEARTQRELALASLSLLIADAPPQTSPIPVPEEHLNPENQKEVSK